MAKSEKIKLTYANWRFFSWTENFEKELEDGSFDGKWNRLIRGADGTENKNALKRHQSFIAVALELAARLSDHPEIERIALFGSLARPPVLEPHPYSKRLRNRGVHVFHSPTDIDLAIWLSSFDNLGAIRKTMTKTVGDMAEKAIGLCDGSVELFVFDHQNSQYLGRICHFNRCPKGYDDCILQGCGTPKHLKTMKDFVLYPDAISRINSEILFERTGAVELPAKNLFSELPQKLPEELIEKLIDAPDVRIERIVSTGHASPPGFWYDQPASEWVVVLRGEATLAFEDEVRLMRPGDYVSIPPHRKHRINPTSQTEPTVWLAVFFNGKKKAKNNRKNC